MHIWLYQPTRSVLSTMTPVIELFEFLAELTGQNMVYTYTDLARVLLIIPFFLYASYLDIKERLIPEKLWYPLIGLGILFIAVDLLFFSIPSVILPRMARNIFVGLLLGGGLYYAPQLPFLSDRLFIFGKADMKALIVAALFIPTYPLAGPFPLFYPEPYLFRIFIFAVFQWAAFASLLYLFVLGGTMFVRNARTGSIEFPESVISYRIPTADLHEEINRRVLHDQDGSITMQGFPARLAEDYINWWNNTNAEKEINDLTEIERVRLKRFLNTSDEWGPENVEDSEYGEESLEKDREYFRQMTERDYVWVTPDTPFLALIFVGLMLAIIIGDPAYVLALIIG